MIVEGSTFSEVWFKLLGRLFHTGKLASPRGFETRELLGVQVRVYDLKNNILIHQSRSLGYRFMVAEWLWMAAGREDVATVAKYNKNMAQFSDDGVKFNGAYGPRVATQMDWAMEQLAKPWSRQCIVQIWTPAPAPSKDIPCTLSWQLLNRDGRLNAVVTMRSSDIWLGLPYDFFNFSMLTNALTGHLGLKPGELIFNLGSSHLYDRDRTKAEVVLEAYRQLSGLTSPALPGLAPADEILDRATATEYGTYDGTLEEPWSTYRNVLQAPTNAAALDLLGCLKPTQGDRV